ncbi:hypothetical protein [Butyrivibrio virus Ceridwen]|nr:hypothetical protein [Butyrivibrio virus Ceridwen]
MIYEIEGCIYPKCEGGLKCPLSTPPSRCELDITEQDKTIMELQKKVAEGKRAAQTLARMKHKEQQKQWYILHREERKKHMREYMKAHREERNKYMREYMKERYQRMKGEKANV